MVRLLQLRFDDPTHTWTFDEVDAYPADVSDSVTEVAAGPGGLYLTGQYLWTGDSSTDEWTWNGWRAAGVAVDAGNQVFIADWMEGCIRIVNSLGQVLQRFGSEGTDAGLFTGAQAVACAADGTLYVSDVVGEGLSRVEVFSPGPAPKVTHTITASADAHGSITPSGTVTVDDGADQSFTISADPNHHVADVNVDGVSQGAITSYTFTNVTADHALAATFAVDTYTLDYSAGAGGADQRHVSADRGLRRRRHRGHGGAGRRLDFVSWDDGSTANPRTDANVTADVNVAAQFEADSAPPPTGSMVLNIGDATTYNRLIGIDSSGVTGATEMRTSTDDKATWSDWQAFAAQSVVALPGLAGTKTVWVEYGNTGPGVLESSAAVILAVSPIEAGCNFSLTVAADGSLRTWGNNESGQIGDGTTSVKRSIPTYVSSSSVWNTVSGGVQHTLGLKSDGSLWAWGDNAYGQLGIGLVGNKTTPTPVGGATDWASVSAGYIHSLALKTDRTLWAWGDNYYGELGDGTNTNSGTPQQIGVGNWKAVSTGYLFNLAIRSDGTLWAWGDNSDGQIGNGTKTNVNHPVQISGEGTWAAVSAGNWHSLALKNDGTLWALGPRWQLSAGRRHKRREVDAHSDWHRPRLGRCECRREPLIRSQGRRRSVGMGLPAARRRDRLDQH